MALLGQRPRLRLRSVLAFAVMVAIAAIVLYPLQILIFTAFKSEAELVTNPLGVPNVWTTAGFGRAWTDARMGSLMVNSLIVSTSVVIGTVGLASLGGFAFGRLRFWGKRAFPVLLTIGLVLPFEVLMLPIFYTFRGLGLLDSYVSLILPQIALGLPFGILLLRGFIADLPHELFDAGEIDGAGLWAQYRHIAMPLARPALIALAVFQFLWSWNQYLIALVMVQRSDLRTIPLGLSFFIGRFETNYTALASAAVIALLPSLTLYIVFHRHVLKANLAGALK
ncbi:MAG: raffinose/stachyose/melibiose transport system permease protein [Chloroflexota bacterium]|jgi:ABC-type glycerol-3-phosphate transport system permease component|nr:raffinose/stachyose/melibiose transport system permease protein [Chloroflexota bacterium]